MKLLMQKKPNTYKSTYLLKDNLLFLLCNIEIFWLPTVGKTVDCFGKDKSIILIKIQQTKQSKFFIEKDYFH